MLDVGVRFEVGEQSNQVTDWLPRGAREPLASMGMYHYAMFVYSTHADAFAFDAEDFVTYRFAESHPEAKRRVQKLRVEQVFRVPRLFGFTMPTAERDPETNAMSFVGTWNMTVTMETGPVNLVSHPHGVFLRESSLGHSVIDSLGKRSCIRRIPIRSSYGEVEYDDLQQGTRDFIDCSGANVRNLHFRRTDDKGSTIPLETPLSFSLVFSPTHN